MDLLLDTICNTFGGLVFIALLLSLLVQQTAVVQTAKMDAEGLAEAELEVIEAEEELRAVSTEANVVRDQLNRGRATLAIRLGLDDREVATEQLHQFIDLVIALDAQADAEDARAAAEVRAAAAKQKLAGAAVAVTVAEKELAEAHDEARKQAAEKRVTLRVPRERASIKNQVALLLRDGRLRQIFVYDASGAAVRVNRAEVDVAPDDATISPEQFRGGDLIANQDGAVASLNRRLVPFSPTRHYMMIAVWPDSHQAFRHVRDSLVERGYDYQLLLLEEGDNVVLGGGGPSTVQ